MLQQQLEHVRARIQGACQRCGRSASSVTLVAVTKTVPVVRIREALALGVTDLGENRVQEALAKRDALAPETARWHLIGHLQRNKARFAVESFETVHSVDSIPLVRSLEEQAAQRRPAPLEVLIQVNVSGEASKHGCRPEDLEPMAAAIQAAGHLRLVGLMTMPPWTDDPQQSRPHFRRLRELRDGLATAAGLEPQALRLSMGMSGDFEVAIEEGADWVRVGSAIFGDRGPGTGERQ